MASGSPRRSSCPTTTRAPPSRSRAPSQRSSRETGWRSTSRPGQRVRRSSRALAPSCVSREAPPAVRLADHTTIRLGGPARDFTSARTEHDLIEAVAAADARREPLLILGGGSNLVVADEGFDGTVVQVATRGVSRGTSPGELTAAAGEEWDGVVARTVAEGLAGLECLSGIPGLTGATPMQNVGAYGQEVSDTITRVRVWDRVAGEVLQIPA